MSDGSNNTEEIKKHPGLWLPYGNVAIVVEKTAFKMPSALLSGVSEVFRDMFEFPLGNTTSEMYEGLPLIVLYDTAEDVAMLFDALVQGFRLPRRDLRATAYPRAVLRLSNKYGIQIFRPMLEQYFSEIYPLSPTDYDHRLEIDELYIRACRSHGLLTEDLSRPIYYTSIFQNWPYDFSRDITAAREVGLDSILPCAFYGLYACMTGDAHLNNTSTWLEGLELENVQRVVKGQGILGTKLVPIYMIPSSHHLALSERSCSTRSRCLTEVDKWRAINEKKTNDRAFLTPLHMLRALNEAAEQINDTHSICIFCKSALRASYMTRRLGIWNQLPEIFDLVKPRQKWDSVRWDIPYVSGYDDVAESPSPM